jgi:hypothetical protein
MAGYSTAAEGPSNLAESDHRLAWGNRRLIAERTHWPAGALEACERLERRFPHWSPMWRHGNHVRGFERPPGFYACEWPPYLSRDARCVYGVTPEMLAAVLAAQGHP